MDSSPPVINAATIIDESPWSPLQKRVAAICFCLALLEGFDSQAMGYAAPKVAQEFGLGPAGLSVVFTVGLLGMFLGSGAFGLIADRVGRRRVVLAGTALFGVFTLLIAVFGNNVETLAALRFVAGIGMGGTIAVQVALVAEYTPARIRSTVIMVLVGALGLGSFVGGLLATAMLPSLGWRSIFVVGGALPIVLVAWMLPGLPDSIRFLIASGRHDRARTLLRRVAPQAMTDEKATLMLPEVRAHRSPVATLFTERRAMATTLVWIAFFMNFLAVYLLLSWLPVLFGQAGLSPQMATAATATFTLGGFVGAIVLGLLVDRRAHSSRTLAIGYLGAAVFAVVASLTTDQPAILFVAIFFAGFGVIGCQGGLSAAAASMYPTSARGTGVGWATGFGRLGSILGPTLGGALLASGLAATSVIAVAAVPVALAAVAVGPLGLVNSRREATNPVEQLQHADPAG
ncbi:MFS transporter [Pseudonocardia sulfidoxydans NBRC 16205]|uniref:MFS transporter n=1 Tax=Pseudonocardia sulfidoxydans NBRC 16205 TaxID=1223511 RepID=A0A511DG13_9PSEU|nr:MFS transporter [Pseudonocardia sulfidoxydans]GEL23720.1 MFS transporter [Pseudonocardia sulfidoxydans NBRC 16205]